jgi:hypothetical protein
MATAKLSLAEIKKLYSFCSILTERESTTLKVFATVSTIFLISVCLVPISLSEQEGQFRAVPTVYKATIEGLVRDVACPIPGL